MQEHTFSWRGERFTLAFSVDRSPRGLQLIVDDVSGRSIESINALPDWVVEREACRVAADHGAHYL